MACEDNKYDNKQHPAKRWTFGHLVDPEKMTQRFHHASVVAVRSSKSVLKWMAAHNPEPKAAEDATPEGPGLKLPGNVFFSTNHFRPEQPDSPLQFRRLKNVIVVLEWCCKDTSEIQPRFKLSSQQLQLLQFIFKVLDTSGSRSLPTAVVRRSLLSAMDVAHVEADAGLALLRQLGLLQQQSGDGDENGDGAEDNWSLNFDALQKVIEQASLSEELPPPTKQSIRAQMQTKLDDMQQQKIDAAKSENYDAAERLKNEIMELTAEIEELDAAIAKDDNLDEGPAQYKRFFVAVNLAEAESVRCALHERREAVEKGVSLPESEVECAVCLRLSDSVLLDSSPTYREGAEYQRSEALTCLRYMDSRPHFTDRDASLLLRALQPNTRRHRLLWWLSTRACRRREQIMTWAPGLQRCFGAADDLARLWQISVCRRIGDGFEKLGLTLVAAFRALDHNRDGLVNCSEIFSAMKSMKIAVTPDLVHLFMKSVHLQLGLAHEPGYLTSKDFVKLFSPQALWPTIHPAQHPLDLRFDDTIDNADESGLIDLGAAMDEAEGEDEEPDNEDAVRFKQLRVVELSPQQQQEQAFALEQQKRAKLLEEISRDRKLLKKIKVKFHTLKHFQCVWTSEMSGSRSHASIWAPHLTKSHRNRRRICIGHFAKVIMLGCLFA